MTPEQSRRLKEALLRLETFRSMRQCKLRELLLDETNDEIEQLREEIAACPMES
jgi:hypothetical protein